MIKRLLVLVIGLMVLAGCATQRPVMPDEKYVAFADAWNTVGYCAYMGWMDADTAARGKTYINSAINTYTYSLEDMSDTIKGGGARLSGITKETCRTTAVGIHTRKQQIDNQNAQVEMQQREVQGMINSTKSANTYCNRIGTQVFCNSF